MPQLSELFRNWSREEMFWGSFCRFSKNGHISKACKIWKFSQIQKVDMSRICRFCTSPWQRNGRKEFHLFSRFFLTFCPNLKQSNMIGHSLARDPRKTTKRIDWSRSCYFLSSLWTKNFVMADAVQMQSKMEAGTGNSKYGTITDGNGMDRLP